MMIRDQQQTIETLASTDTLAPASAEPNRASSKSAGKVARRRSKMTSQSSAKSPTKQASKQEKVLSLLRRKEGVSIASIMKRTAWQKHSVHGFLAGVVRKKLGLNLQSEDSGGQRVYRIVTGKSSPKATAAQRKRGH